MQYSPLKNIEEVCPRGVAMVTAFVTVDYSFDAKPTVNSPDELAVATSGPHNHRRRSTG